MSRRRVVVTGLGTVNPLGCQVEESWQNALNGQSGVRLIDEFDTSQHATKFAGLVPSDFDVSLYLSPKEAKKCDLFIQYGIAASCQAVEDAGLDKMADSLDVDRAGIIMGSGIGGLTTIENNAGILEKSGPRRISPFFIPASIINMISGHVSIKYGFRGPNLAVATACTTGTHAIGLAHRTIAYGDADIMVAGGAEKASTPLGMGGFASARALSSRNDDPQGASRPWDVDRDGFVLGDGAGAIVLEEYEHAKKRGAKIYAELVGFGMSADAFHITRPPEGAVGAQISMKAAIQDAGITDLTEINYVNAHGTSTPAGDVEESIAIEKVLGEAAASQVAVSSTKSMTGHLLGAAGAIEAIFTILAIRDQIAPPTINLNQIDEGCNLDYVPNKAKEMTINAALSNSFGFGGTNGSLVFRKVS